MSLPPPHLYRQQALEQGLDEHSAGRALEVMRAVGGRGATPVLTLKHLAVLTGVSHMYLRDVVTRRRDPYVSIVRPKSRGKPRPISSPEPVLMDIQRWILGRILGACTPDDASYAYQRRRSIVDCASRHAGARWMVKLDIHDFFGRVGERPVFEVFAGLGYPRLLSLEFCRLCTRVRGTVPQTLSVTPKFRGKAPYHVFARGYLPQGAPTSGALANLVMNDVDRELTAFADRQGLVFTRYSDDMVFSSTGTFSREQARAVVYEAAQRLERHGFMVHHKKTRIVTPGARKIVLGLLVDGSRPRLLPEFKRRIEVHVRGVERNGLPEHAEHRRFDSILAMINHVDGCIAFAGSVEADYADRIARRWAEVLVARGYPRPGA